MRRLEILSELRFTCSTCGDCCRGVQVLLAPGEKERIAALDWRGRAVELAAVEAVVPTRGPRGEPRFRLARGADDACVFLDADNRCLLHRHFGAEAKPLTCQLYPFTFYPLGDRIGVDVAFSCRSVSRAEGAPVAASLEGFEPRLAGLATAAAAAPTHQLVARRPLAPEVLWEIEADLLALLAERSMAVFDRVRCCLQYLKLATTGDPGTAAAATLRKVMVKHLQQTVRQMPPEDTMDAAQRELFLLWLYLVLNPAPLDLAEQSPRDREREVAARVAAAERFRAWTGSPLIANREIAVTFAGAAAVDAAHAAGAGGEWLATFLGAKIIGQRFLFAGEERLPLVEAARKLLLSYPLAIWTAKALAGARGAAAVQDEDLRQAVRHLDLTLGQVRTTGLPRKQREAWDFLIADTDLVVAATHDVLAGAV